jgi:hypothetical protein
MIESVMLLGIGFLGGCLMMIAFVPAIHGRAVRLTARRYQAATPLAYMEMEAQKDLLRAEYAMTTARLEMLVEEARARSVQYLGEIGRKAAEIHQLRTELGKDETMLSVPQRVRMALARGLKQGQQSDAA